MSIPLNGWIKHFDDGTVEEGFDHLVSSGKATWQGGRLTNMNGVSLSHQGKSLSILGDGTYWQSDTWEVPLFTSAGHFTKRRIEKEILSRDNYLIAFETEDETVLSLLYDLDLGYEEFCVYEFTTADLWKWLCLELDVQTGRISWYISEERI